MKAAYTNTLPFRLKECGIPVCALLDIRPLGPEPTIAEAALQLLEEARQLSHAVRNVTDPGIVSFAASARKSPNTLLFDGTALYIFVRTTDR